MFNKKVIVPLAIVLILLVALLAVLILTQDTPDVTEENTPETSSEFLGYVFDFNTDTITQIDVSTQDESYCLLKENSSWKLNGNEAASISSASVSSLASSIGSVSYSEIISDGSISPEDCGIDSSSDSLTFVCELGEISINRGMETTDGSVCYITTSLSDDIYFADADDVSKLFAPLTKYRNGISLRVDFDSLASITVNGDVLIKLEKKDASSGEYNTWKMLTPVQIGASDEFIAQKITDSLKTIKIKSFASDSGNFADFGMAGKTKYLTIADTHGKKQTVYFSGNQNGVCYISVDDGLTIYELESADAPYSQLRPIDVADRNINLAKMSNISRVTLKGAELDYTIEFAEKGGKINGKDVTSDVMNQKVFTGVCGLMADDIYTGDAGAAAVTLRFEYNDSKQDTIVFSDHNDRFYSVTKNGETKYLILKTKIEELSQMLENESK